MTARSAYIHVPFCKYKCGYRNFSNVAGRDDLVPAFLAAIELEMERKLPDRNSPEPSVELDSLYLGGWTPSYLSLPDLQRLLELLAARFRLSENAEYTFEAHPLDCIAERLEQLRLSGVNRLSIAGQSFQARKLHRLQHAHTGDNLRDSMRRVMVAFGNVSLNLVFAVPGETLAEWRADLEAAIELAPQHVSIHRLVIERGSAFFSHAKRGRLREVEEDLQLAMHKLAIERLKAAGYELYGEHDTDYHFALPGFECRHHIADALGKSLWAFGPGAVSVFDGLRSTNHRSTTTYIRGLIKQDQSDPTDPTDQIRSV